MSTSTAIRPRFTCRVVRSWISILGDGSPGQGRGLGSGHVATCGDCQRFYGDCRELESSLTRVALTSAQRVPTGLERRIVDAIRVSARPAPRRFPSLGLISLGGALAAVAFAVFLVPKAPGPGNPEALAPAEIVAMAQSAANRVLSPLKPVTDTLEQQDPLQNQVASVYSDAQSAVRFLALNFLPSSATAPIIN